MLMLPSDHTEGQGDGASATEDAKWSDMWYLGHHVVRTLQASAVAEQWHPDTVEHGGCHLSAYDLSSLSVGVFRALLRVRTSCSVCCAGLAHSSSHAAHLRCHGRG